MQQNKVNDVEAYLYQFPKEVQSLLKQLRKTIQSAAPKAEEYISYQMPAYKYYGMLVFFAGYKNHIGFYPGKSGITAFVNEITNYKFAKGSIQFPLDKPLPIRLITRIIKYRVQENEVKNELKQIKKSPAKKQKS